MTKVLQDFYLCEVLPAYHYPEQAEQNLALKFHAIIQKFEDLYNLAEHGKQPFFEIRVHESGYWRMSTYQQEYNDEGHSLNLYIET